MANKTDRSFELKISLNNAAFDDLPIMMIDRVLNEVRTSLSHGFLYGKIRDINGNTIGSYKVKGIFQ